MMRVFLDDRVSEFNQSNEKLGDFLNHVSANLPPNRIITEVVMDGIQIPKHRQREAFAKSLQRVQELQIRTADATLLAAHGLDTAISNVERLRQTLLHAAELLRESNKGDANRYFHRCIEGLERFLETILVTRNVMRLDFSKIQIDGILLSKIEQEFTAILNDIVSHQENQNFDEVADQIEYALLTNLHAWSRALNQIRRSRSSNA
jgi:hypothetical protein